MVQNDCSLAKCPDQLKRGSFFGLTPNKSHFFDRELPPREERHVDQQRGKKGNCM